MIDIKIKVLIKSVAFKKNKIIKITKTNFLILIIPSKQCFKNRMGTQNNNNNNDIHCRLTFFNPMTIQEVQSLDQKAGNKESDATCPMSYVTSRL